MLMDIDRGLALAVLVSGIESFHSSDVTVDMLEGSGKEALAFMDAHWRAHGRLPSRELVLSEAGVDFRDVPVEPVKFWAGEVRKRHLYNALRESLDPLLTKMEKYDSFGALDVLSEQFFRLQGLLKSNSGVERVFGDIESILEEHDRASLGITGVPTPYPALNDLTQGWQPEDLIVIAGRPGVGKTMLLLMFALHPWKARADKVMMVSTEMSQKALRRRCAALVTKTSYSKIKRGKLTSYERAAFAAGLEKLRDDPNLIMMGKHMRVDLESVHAQALIHKPKLLVIDGFYLMKSSRLKGFMKKSDRIAELLDMTKEMAKDLEIPVAISTQMNRPPSERGAKGAKPDLDRLAFSDNMGMIADYVFFLDRTQKDRESNEMRISPVKVREGEFIGSIVSAWDFDKGDFGQRRVDDGSQKAPPPPDSEVPLGTPDLAPDYFSMEDIPPAPTAPF